MAERVTVKLWTFQRWEKGQYKGPVTIEASTITQAVSLLSDKYTGVFLYTSAYYQGVLDGRESV